MATFGEITYAVLDLLKERADDAYYTEEHVIFFAKKIRALLLERKYKQTRNSAFTEMSSQNKQQICLDVEPAEVLSSGCAGGWLKSTKEIPDSLDEASLHVYPVSDLINAHVSFIPAERMPYVGHNKWLKHIVYCAKGGDGHLYLNSANPNFLYLRKVKAEGVFSDPEKAAELSCDGSGDGGKCDILKATFPLEDALIPSLIEMVTQELIGSRYAPEDKHNDAKDDLAQAAVTQQRHPRPAENSTYKAKEEAE